MRILVVGDQHFRYELPYASAISDGRKAEWEAVKKTIHDTAKTCDAVVLMGDNFNSRHNHSSVIREFVDFLNEFGDKEVHLLVGNHERYGSSTALDFLKNIKHKNWHVYLEPTQTMVAGQEAMMIPYMTPALLGVETREEGVKAILDSFPSRAWPLAFAHHGVAGARIHGMPIDFMNEIVLPQKDLEQHFSHVFAGHVHSPQHIFPSIYMTGNIFTNEVGEHSKSIWIYESDGTIDVEVKEVKLPVRGIFKYEFGATDEGYFNLNFSPQDSIVKAIVTDRGIIMDELKASLARFDASIIVEQYPNERSKVHFEEGGMDLSVDNLLKLYAEAKGLKHSDLSEGFDLIKN